MFLNFSKGTKMATSLTKSTPFPFIPFLELAIVIRV